mmetsp:Transcript_76959/g.200163  ORF Transcript_76959/g.200163 Transcript_76959/m.200163 type:complete len:249 (+) Transcript_76959:100-846(+)
MPFSATAPVASFVQPSASPWPTTNSDNLAYDSKDFAAHTDDHTVRFRKTRLCRFFPKCQKGTSCPFAHGRNDMRACPDLTKTKLCVAWHSGTCAKPASACKFAHGSEELRSRKGIFDVTEDVALSPAVEIEAWTAPKLLLENPPPEENSLNFPEFPPATEGHTIPGATSTCGGQNLGHAVHTDNLSHEPLASTLAFWLLQIKKLVSYHKGVLDADRVELNSKHLHEALPTPEECRLALALCTPECYQD